MCSKSHRYNRTIFSFKCTFACLLSKNQLLPAAGSFALEFCKFKHGFFCKASCMCSRRKACLPPSRKLLIDKQKRWWRWGPQATNMRSYQTEKCQCTTVSTATNRRMQRISAELTSILTNENFLYARFLNWKTNSSLVIFLCIHILVSVIYQGSKMPTKSLCALFLPKLP